MYICVYIYIYRRFGGVVDLLANRIGSGCGAMRCDCDALQCDCDAMRCVAIAIAMRCDAVRACEEERF